MLKRKTLIFTVILDQDPDSDDVGVTVPDLPGCFSAGTSLEDALANSQEAIIAHLEALVDLGMPVPQTRRRLSEEDLKEFMSENSIAALSVVSTDALLGHKKRVNVTLPVNALSQFDRIAEGEGENRSSLLTRLMVNYVKDKDKDQHAH